MAYIALSQSGRGLIYKDINFNDFLPDQNIDCTLHSFNEVSSDKIKSYVSSLSSNKAITDQLPLRVIKAIFPIIVHSVTHIVNLSLSTGQFPDSCKLAVVSPIFKGGDANDPNDYRPISILPLVSKCIENVFQMTLISFFLLMTPIFSFELLQRMPHIQKQMISLKKFLTT